MGNRVIYWIAPRTKTGSVNYLLCMMRGTETTPIRAGVRTINTSIERIKNNLFLAIEQGMCYIVGMIRKFHKIKCK